VASLRHGRLHRAADGGPSAGYGRVRPAGRAEPADLAQSADLAFILTPVQAVEGVLDDMGAAGIPNAVVLASGYREVGEAGRALEDALLDRAVANGVTMLGPNCLGFVNANRRSAPTRWRCPRR